MRSNSASDHGNHLLQRKERDKSPGLGQALFLHCIQWEFATLKITEAPTVVISVFFYD